MDTYVRRQGDNVWIGRAGSFTPHISRHLNFETLESEETVGRAMLDEIQTAANEKVGDLTILLLGGRGAQALHRLLGRMAETPEADGLLGRLHVFTQDALAPMRKDNAFSFVRDFERLLGRQFFAKIKSFTPMRTDVEDFPGELRRYVETLESRGGIDIFFLGLGPESDGASHIAYIKPGSGAQAADLAGVIPISPRSLDHHIAKFKAGGTPYRAADEEESP